MSHTIKLYLVYGTQFTPRTSEFKVLKMEINAPTYHFAGLISVLIQLARTLIKMLYMDND